MVFAFPAGQFRALAFTNVAGISKLGDATATNGPDGGNFAYKIASFNGIAGINAPVLGYLAGVFLDSNEPADPSPPALDFSVIGMNFATLSPQIGQVFFIGDGLTGTSAGSIQEFIVPTNATRLFLGVADSGYYNGEPGYFDDNTGSFSVTIDALPFSPLTHSVSQEFKAAGAGQTSPSATGGIYTTSSNPIVLQRDATFGFELPNTLRLSLDIETSSDLIHWAPLTNMSLYFRDEESTNYPQRFYRFGKQETPRAGPHS